MTNFPKNIMMKKPPVHNSKKNRPYLSISLSRNIQDLNFKQGSARKSNWYSTKIYRNIKEGIINETEISQKQGLYISRLKELTANEIK